MRDWSEQALVDGLRRGDAASFDAVYALYRPRIHAFLLRLAGRRDIAEDLAQETWVKLARAATTLAPDTDLAAWLFTVARNAHVSWRRWAFLDVSRIALAGETVQPAASTTSAEDRTDAARAIARLERALATLPAASREVLLLVAIEGFDQEQAAAILGVRYDALRQRLSRARAQLGDALDRAETDALPRGAARAPLPRGAR